MVLSRSVKNSRRCSTFIYTVRFVRVCALIRKPWPFTFYFHYEIKENTSRSERDSNLTCIRVRAKINELSLLVITFSLLHLQFSTTRILFIRDWTVRAVWLAFKGTKRLHFVRQDYLKKKRLTSAESQEKTFSKVSRVYMLHRKQC